MKKIWYIQSKSKIFGPYTILQVRVLLQRGKINHSTRISLDKQSWLPLDKSQLVAQIKAAKAKKRGQELKNSVNTPKETVTANVPETIIQSDSSEKKLALDPPTAPTTEEKAKEVLTENVLEEIASIETLEETLDVDSSKKAVTSETIEKRVTADLPEEIVSTDTAEKILTVDEKLQQKLEERRQQLKKFNGQKLFNMARISLIILLFIAIIKGAIYYGEHISNPSNDKAYASPKTAEQRIKYLEEALLFVVPTYDPDNPDKRCVITTAVPTKAKATNDGTKTTYTGQYRVQANIGTVDGFKAKPTGERCFEGTLDYTMKTQTVASEGSVAQLRANFNAEAYYENIVYAKDAMVDGEQELNYGQRLLKGQIDLPTPNGLTFDAYKAEREKLNKRAFQMIAASADQGNKAAYAILAQQYYAGIGTSADINRAITWLEKIPQPDEKHVRYITELKTERGACLRAKQNPSNKARYAALMLECARLAAKHKQFAKVISSLTPIAQDGDADAQYLLSQVYTEGNYDAKQSPGNYTGKLFYGIESNYDTAYKWLEEAANSGKKQAQIEFAATAYDNSNPQIAFNFFSQLANENSEFTPLAQSYLAKQYYDGYGVEQDREKAIELMQQAAENDANDAVQTLQEWTHEALDEALEEALNEEKKAEK